MTFVTYAQNFEDVMLWRALKHVKNGFYIDVGANDPDQFSVTKAFYEKGWRGINIEPVEEWIEKLNEVRPQDINILAAASNESGTTNIFVFPNTGLSTSVEEHKRLHVDAGFDEPREVSVQSVTLDEVCGSHEVKAIHFLKIDVEGAEKEVLEGLAFKEHRPWILLIEATAPLSNTDVSDTWQQYVLDRDYDFVYFDGLNKYFLAKEHGELAEAFTSPPNVLDDFVPALRIAHEERIESLAAHINGLASSLETARQTISDARARVAEYESALQTERQAVSQARAQVTEYEISLRAERKAVSEARAHTTEYEMSLRAERQALSEAQATIIEQANALRQADQLAANNIDLQDMIALRDASLRELHTSVEAMAAQISQRDSSLSALQAELAGAYQSRSWRLTHPLRRMNYLRARGVSRVKRTVKQGVLAILLFLYPFVVRSRPLRRVALELMNCFPNAKSRVRLALYGRMSKQTSATTPDIPRQSAIEDETTSTSADAARHVLRDDERVVLFYVEHTAMFDRITGVQRVCHKLAAMLEAGGETLVLVKLDRDTLELAPLNAKERAHFLTQSGLAFNERCDPIYEPEVFRRLLDGLKLNARQPWLIIPEVTYHTTHPNPPTSRLLKLSRDLGLRSGVVFYDVIPFLTKDAAENALKHANYLSVIAQADVLWPISRYSEERLVDYYRRHEKLTEAEMPTISTRPLAEEMETSRYLTRNSEVGSIVCVGTIDERKNQISLVEAFNRYCAQHPETEWKLHIVGLVRENYKAVIEKAAAGNRNIEFHYNSSDAEVQQLYQDCHFTVFPSLEEGYGLPIVESLWKLRPCICANFGSMGELAENGGCLAINTHSIDAIHEALASLIGDAELYKRKINEIMHRPVRTWFEYASAISGDMDRLQFGPKYEGLIYYWLDATVSTAGNTGIQRVSRQLARHLIDQGHKLVPIKWDDSAMAIALASDDDLLHMSKWNGPAEDGWFRPSKLAPGGDEDTYLMVDLPLNRSLHVQDRVIDYFKDRDARCVAIFYDAIPAKLSAIYPPHFAAAHQEYMKLLDRMDLVLPISETSAADLVNFLNRSNSRGLALETRVRVATLPSVFPQHSSSQDLPVRSDNDVCHILAVGTVEPRKNHKSLIRAFQVAEQKSSRKLKLTVLGGGESFDSELPGQIEALINDASNIEWIRSPSDEILRQHYQQADFTVFASYEEGFGLPIVESLWFGVPCICAGFGQMAELAAHGGCVTVNVLNIEELSEAMVNLADDSEMMQRLRDEITTRHFKTWDDYAAEVSASIRTLQPVLKAQITPVSAKAPYQLPPMPVLSVCVTTYNRADWLEVNLENLLRVSAPVRERIEIIVCDNCSTDQTPTVMERFRRESGVTYYRNTANIGMLGNLPETVSHARGDYVWLVGDDDLIHAGALEQILDVIDSQAPDLINVNYAYSPNPPPKDGKLDAYLSTATIICNGDASHAAPVKEISAFNENFYTAIYTFVVMRKHAQKIFTQETSGAPFTSLQTCVPSSKYILSELMELPGYWINEPMITINMNVSWGQYAPLWILERVPEVYDLAEINGVPQDKVDRWRRHTMQMVPQFFEQLLVPECKAVGDSFDVVRFVRRSRHLPEFRAMVPELLAICAEALNRAHPLATSSIDALKDAIE